MKSFEKKWAFSILCIIFLAFAVPYTILSNIPAWYGSFLFWILITVIVIFMNYFITKEWGN
jgi:c-di-AMP phosphodiesterase-like protein